MALRLLVDRGGLSKDHEAWQVGMRNLLLARPRMRRRREELWNCQGRANVVRRAWTRREGCEKLCRATVVSAAGRQDERRGRRLRRMRVARSERIGVSEEQRERRRGGERSSDPHCTGAQWDSKAQQRDSEPQKRRESSARDTRGTAAQSGCCLSRRLQGRRRLRVRFRPSSQRCQAQPPVPPVLGTRRE